MPLTPCTRCGTPHAERGGRCADCRPERPPRGNTTARGLGWQHQQRAADLKAQAMATGTGCCLCGEPILFDASPRHPLSFNAHHLTRDRLGPLGPAHRRCNERAGEPDA